MPDFSTFKWLAFSGQGQVEQAQEAADDRVQDYNELRPHESLGDLAQKELIARKFFLRKFLVLNCPLDRGTYELTKLA
jgi:hypothetical protein